MLRGLGMLALSFRPALEHPQSNDRYEGDDKSEEKCTPQTTLQVLSKSVKATRDLRTLDREIGVVELLDVSGDVQNGLAARQNFTSQESTAPGALAALTARRSIKLDCLASG